MSKIENSIGWCDETTNGVTGCSYKSPGCVNCYAEVGTRARVLRSRGHETWGPKAERFPVNFEPVFRRLNKLCMCDKCHEAHPFDQLGKQCRESKPETRCKGLLRRIRLFADSNSDWLDERWTVETLARFLDAIRKAPNIDTILLTKRPENFHPRMLEVFDFLSDRQTIPEFSVYNWLADWIDGDIPPHIWLGVSVEDQKRADDRIPELLKIPAPVRFLSVEPLLEKVDLKIDENWALTRISKPDWVIVGGESGPDGKRRDCGVEAITSVADQCVAAGVPVYVKQDTAFKSGQQGRIPDDIWKLKQFPVLNNKGAKAQIK